MPQLLHAYKFQFDKYLNDPKIGQILYEENAILGNDTKTTGSMNSPISLFPNIASLLFIKQRKDIFPYV